MSTVNVKNGYTLPLAVDVRQCCPHPPYPADGSQVETYTANGFLNDKLRDGDALSKFEELMNEVFHRKTVQLPPIPYAWQFLYSCIELSQFNSTSSFRIPPRVTLNDAKRQAWFSDLANPDVPLSKLGKSVPHGAKGHDLLDQLHDNNVAVNRAVWVLRMHGANETVCAQLPSVLRNDTFY